jgi:HEAT repeat protein
LLGAIVNEDVLESLIAAFDVAIEAEKTETDTLETILFSLAKHGEITGALPASLQERIEALLESEESTIRVLAIRILGWLPGDDIEAKLEELLNSSDGLVRVEAITALAHRGVADEVTIAALSDPYIGVGIAAARALAQQKCAEVASELVIFASTHDGTYRRDIGQLFGKYAPEAGAQSLLELLADEDKKGLWLVAIDALAELYLTQDKQPDISPEARLVA